MLLVSVLDYFEQGYQQSSYGQPGLRSASMAVELHRNPHENHCTVRLEECEAAGSTVLGRTASTVTYCAMLIFCKNLKRSTVVNCILSRQGSAPTEKAFRCTAIPNLCSKISCKSVIK